MTAAFKRSVPAAFLAVMMCGGLVRQPASAQGTDTPLCSFVKKVAGAAASEFVAFKGEEIPNPSKSGTQFKGTLRPDSAAKCTLNARRNLGGEVLPPLYACKLTGFVTFKQAKPIYEKAAAELRSCFPRAAFKERRIKDVAIDWELKTRQPEFDLKLELVDDGALAALSDPKLAGKPGIMVKIWVIATAPAPNRR